MLIWKTDEVSAPNKVVIRGHASPIPFEPHRVQSAMLQAFEQLYGSILRQDEALLPSWEHLWHRWRLQLTLTIRHLWLLLNSQAHGNRAKLLAVRAPRGASVPHGFFSSVKPNLRNAP